MKIIFFGTPEFAAFSLNFLIKKNYEVIAVVTSPDTKKGRGRNVLPTQVKEKALENNIPILQPIDLNDHLLYLTKGKCWAIPTTCIRGLSGLEVSKKNNYIFYLAK